MNSQINRQYFDIKTLKILVWLVLVLLLQGTGARAGIIRPAGSYQLELSTTPSIITTGSSRLTLHLRDRAGKPVDGAEIRVLVNMPTMGMGEHEETARPVNGSPGEYTAPAVFAMEGSYEAKITISGPAGNSQLVIPLTTGQDTTGEESLIVKLIPWLVLIVIALFIFWRMRRTGQKIEVKSVISRGTITGTFLVLLMLVVSIYAVKHWRRAGAMTPIEAQAMEMSTPAPPSSVPVTLARVDEGTVAETITYTGQAVGFSEQEVAPRASGWLTWMPYYVGQKVHAGQLLARLDTSQTAPLVGERAAALRMARQGIVTARSEYQRAEAEKHQAHGEESIRYGAIAEARAGVEAARQEQAGAEAQLSMARAKAVDVSAGLHAAEADADYWNREITRMRQLLAAKAVSQEEFQRENAQAVGSQSKLSQAKAAVEASNAEIRVAEASVRKAKAMLNGAISRVSSVQAELSSHIAHVRSAGAAAQSAQSRILEAEAGATGAAAGLQAATTSQAYSEVHALINGVITRRSLNPGALVNPGQSILQIASIDPIRVQANVAEADLMRLRPGALVRIRGMAAGNAPIEARLTSTTPAVDPVSRTGIVEAIVPNPKAKLLPGQYISMELIPEAGKRTMRVPDSAVIRHGLTGEVTTTVWAADPVAGQEGEYTARRVTIKAGSSGGGFTAIESGLKKGDLVIVTGQQNLHEGDPVAAQIAQGSAPAASTMDPNMKMSAPGGGHAPADSAMDPNMKMPPSSTSMTSPVPAENSATVEISSAGFKPSQLTLRAGIPAKVTFIRMDEKNCATEIVFPAYGIRKPLPLRQPVVVEFTPKQGEFTFSCGMNMLHGTGVAR